MIFLRLTKYIYNMQGGVDEAGRGPVIGPLVVAGVSIEDEDILIEMDVKDSKKLSPSKREFLFDKINDVANVHYKIIPPEQIDDMRTIMTMNEMEVKIFAEVIDLLDSDVVYVDSVDVNEKRFALDIEKRLKTKKRIVSEHKADEIYPIVSTASIIAKVIRDREIKKISDEIGFFGSGYPSDVRTIKFIKEYLKKNNCLPPHVRKSWKTIKRLSYSLNDF